MRTKQAKQRYFFFSYLLSTGGGNLSTISRDGTFPSKSQISESIGQTEFAITGYFEFKSKSDYESFNEINR